MEARAPVPPFSLPPFVTVQAERVHTALSDRYRVDRELGAGGMATVYLAHDLKHDRDVAIKVLQRVKDVRVVIGNLKPSPPLHGGAVRAALRQAAVWTRAWFEGHGLHRLRGTIRYQNPCTLHT